MISFVEELTFYNACHAIPQPEGMHIGFNTAAHLLVGSGVGTITVRPNALGLKLKAFRQGSSTHFPSSEPTDTFYFISEHVTNEGLCKH